MAVNYSDTESLPIELIGSSTVTYSQGNLISLARALNNITSVTLNATEQNSLANLITAVSRAIKRYTRRDFILSTYDEYYNGNGDRRLLVRQYPIQSITRVGYGPYSVMRVSNSNNYPRATAATNSTGMTLFYIDNSGNPNSTTLSFSNYPTISTLATAINALGNGWSATTLSGYSNFPTSDFNMIQGAYNCQGGAYAEFKLHVVDIFDYQVDQARGWLLRGVNALVTQWDDPLNIWTPGIMNYRVIYTAGYAQIPDDVQEACAEWAIALFWQTKDNPAAYPMLPPAQVAFILDHYRAHHPMPI